MPSDLNALTTTQAAHRIGCEDDLFEDIAADHPWLQPFFIGKGRRRLKRWPQAGVDALAYILQHQSEEPSREK